MYFIYYSNVRSRRFDSLKAALSYVNRLSMAAHTVPIMHPDGTVHTYNSRAKMRSHVMRCTGSGSVKRR